METAHSDRPRAWMHSSAGAAQHLRPAAHPQQLAAGVGDGQDAVAVLGGVPHHVVQQREDLGQRMPGAVVGDVT